MSAASAAAYGLRLKGLPPTPWLAVDDAGHWPEVEFRLVPGSAARVDPAGMSAVVPRATELGALVHPVLARLSLELVQRRGLDALHAGALLGRDGAWAVVGEKGAGKSTLLAGCAEAGIEVLTDDVLVLDRSICLAGPRCIDLREPNERFGSGTPVRPDTPRRRLTLPPVTAEAPLAGLVFLAPGEGTPRLDPLAPSECIDRLLARRDADGYPRNPELLLELAGLPMHVLSQPREWAALTPSVELLAGLAGSASVRPSRAAAC